MWISCKFIPLVLIILFSIIYKELHNSDEEFIFVPLIFLIYSSLLFLISTLFLSYVEVRSNGLVTRLYFNKHFYSLNDISQVYQTRIIWPEMGIIILKNQPFLKKIIFFILEERGLTKFYDPVQFRNSKIIQHLKSSIAK